MSELWRRYVDALSYQLNYYMYTNKIDSFEMSFHILYSNLHHFLTKLVDIHIQSDDFVKKITAFNSNMEKSYGNKWQKINFSLDFTTDIVKYLENLFNNPESQVNDEEDIYRVTKILNFFKNLFLKSFQHDDIASSSDKPMILYRGIVGFSINDKSKLLKQTNAFLSTTSDINVAIRHTDFDPNKINITNNDNTNKKVILEIHLQPGIKFIDYNILCSGHTYCEWQKEYILPPGLKFKEKEIKTIEVEQKITIKRTYTKGKNKKGFNEDPDYEIQKVLYDILVVEVSHGSKGGK